MKVTLILADFAEAINGKLYIMGGGWSITKPEPGPMALALKLEVPWNEANMRHSLLIELVDADGQPVMTAPDDGEPQPTKVQVEFEVGRPPGLTPGTPLDMPLAVNIQRGPLPPGTRFTWRLSIDGHHEEDWAVSFTTVAAPS